MKKRALVLMAIILIATLVFVGCTPTSSEEILNGSFEEFKKEDVLSDWSVFTDNSDENVKYTRKFAEIDKNSDDVKYVTGSYMNLDISFGSSTGYGVYQLRQNIKLKRDTVYKLSYSVQVKGILYHQDSSAKAGAFVGILEGSNAKDFYNASSSDGWKIRETYITVENSGNYTFAVGLGLEGDKGVHGQAWFDNVKLEVVDTAPAGVEPVTIVQAGISDGKSEGILYTVFLSIFAIVAVAFAYYMIKRNNYKATMLSGGSDASGNNLSGGDSKSKTAKFLSSSYFIFTASLLGMFIIRFLLAFFTKGMYDELQSMGDLALKIQDVGLNGAYSATTLPISYGMMYILGAIGGIADLAGLSSTSVGMLMLLRLPQIIADLVIFYLIFTLVGKTVGYKQSAIVACLFAVLPNIFSASSAWGLNASIPLAFIIGVVFCMLAKNHWGALACFTLAVIFNVYALIMLPIVIFYLAYYMWKEKNKNLYWALPLAFVGAIVVYFLLSIPFTIDFIKDGKFFYIFSKMGVIFGGNVRITNDVFNFYAIFALGNNTANTATKAVTGILMILFLVALAYMYLRSKNRLDWIGLTATAFITYSFFGLGANFEMAIIGAVLLLIYAIMRDDKRLYKSFGMLSVLNFINIGALLISSGVLGVNPAYQALFKTDWILILGSILTLFAMVYYYIALYDTMVNDYTYEMTPMSSFTQEMSDIKTSFINKKNKIFKR